MVYIRKPRYMRRRVVRTKRGKFSGRAGARFRKYRAKIPAKVHMYKRLGTAATIQNSTVAGTLNVVNSQIITTGTPIADTYGYQFGASMEFKLNNVIDPTDFTSLYDRYKIKGVKVKITPLQNVSTAAGTGILPMLCYALDFDDSAVPTSYEDVARKGFAKTKTLGRAISIYVKPKLSSEIFSGNVLSPGYGINKPMWIDCNSSTVPHYGIKMWFRNALLPGNSSGALQAFRVESTYYLALRDSQ